MRKTNLSPLGFLMEALNIQTVTLARALHVDASLVSKWKSGGRKLTAKSVYFNDIAELLLAEEIATPGCLRQALAQALPQTELAPEQDLGPLLRSYLADTVLTYTSTACQTFNGATAITMQTYSGLAGERQAVDSLLACAEALPGAGELLFLDASGFKWLLADNTYAPQFVSRLLSLLQRGFHVSFVIHYSSRQETSERLFAACAPLIFNRNVDWWSYEYYDDNLLSLSLFCVSRTALVLCAQTNINDAPALTLATTDQTCVLHHEAMAHQIMQRCLPLFDNFAPLAWTEVINSVWHSRRRSAFYSFLPAPTFLFVREPQLREILADNEIETDAQQECLDLNRKYWAAVDGYFHAGRHEPFIYIFQLEEMERRLATQPFISNSLSLLGGHYVCISPTQYACELRVLADELLLYQNLQIVLISERDRIPLPALNCWCQRSTWLIQMDDAGFRISDEPGIVQAASVTLERCLRLVPPVRKEKASVRSYLLTLAAELESLDTAPRAMTGL